jgi:hypothetical protein
MENNNNLRYKHDRMVSDFEADLEDIRRLYVQAVNSRLFWSEVDKIQFEGKWTELVKKLVLSGNLDVLSSFRYRLAIEEEDEIGEKELV